MTNQPAPTAPARPSKPKKPTLAYLRDHCPQLGWTGILDRPEILALYQDPATGLYWLATKTLEADRRDEIVNLSEDHASRTLAWMKGA